MEMGKPLTLVDWCSEPKHEYRCEVTRRQNVIERIFGTGPRRETWIIWAETIEDASRMAHYSFYQSTNIKIEEINHG
jgi:hypothetical protein